MKPKMIGWLIAAIVLAIFVGLTAPHNLPVLGYKALMVCFAVVVAHAIDNTFFRDKGDNVNEIARAVVFLGVMLGLTRGL